MNDNIKIGHVSWSPDYKFKPLPTKLERSSPSDAAAYPLHPDAVALRDRMCSYSTHCVADAMIAYFQLPDCSQYTRERIFDYLTANVDVLAPAGEKTPTKPQDD